MTTTKKTAAKKAKARAPRRKIDPRELTREQWEVLFFGRDPEGRDPAGRVAARSDSEVAREIGGITRQAIRKRREALGIAPCGRTSAPLERPARDAPIRKVIGWRVRLHRDRHRWTLAQVAGAMGGSWNHSSIAVVEHGHTGPGRRGLTLETLQQLAQVLLCSPADLLLLPGQAGLAAQPRHPKRDRTGAKMWDAWDRVITEWKALVSPMMPVVVGLNIARWRLAQGLTQPELAAAALGTETHVHVSVVEHGRTSISLEALAAFAKALAVTPADLVRLPRQPALVPVEIG